MIKINRKDWDKATNEEKIAHCKGYIEDAKKARKVRDFEWYMNYQFQEGNHYIYYNTTTNKLETKPRPKGEVRIVVNKVKSTVRAVQNYSTRFNPKWEILPGGLDPEIIKNARRAGKFMDFLFRSQHLEIVLQGIVDSGLNTSVAFVELDWDETAEGGLGQVMVIEHDSFDVWLDPRAKIHSGLIKGRYLFKGITRSLDEIRSDERYSIKPDSKDDKDENGNKAKFNRELVKSDGEIAASEMKARILRKEGISEDETTKRATVYEFQLYDDEGNDEGGNVQLFTFSGDRVLRDEPLDKTDFTLYCLQVPQDTKKIYHRSWVADLIPLNKALDRVVSQKVMFANQALVFRVLAEKGHGINKITNEMGEWIEHNKGRSVTQWQTSGMPEDGLESRLNSYIEDMGGAHEAALGRMPTGARSGKVLESLQAADSNNLSGIRMSIESFLSVLGSAILDIVADKYVASRIAQITDPEITEDGQRESYISVIGEGASDEIKGDENSNHTIINKGNTLIVKIGSWLGHTMEAKRETLFELMDRKVIPGEEVLRQFEFPNIEDLSEKAREQRLEEHKMDAEIAGRNQEQQQPPQAAPVDQKADKMNKEVRLADQENLQMIQGEIVPPTQGVGLEHTQAHVDFSQTEDFLNESAMNPALKQALQEHIQGELQLQGLL